MEVDKSIVNIYAHFENDSVDFLIFCHLTKANPLPHMCRQGPKELWNIFWFHLDAGVLICEFGPSLFETFEICLESCKWIVVF